MNIEPKADLATKLHNSLERIVSYYDKRDFRCPTMNDQAKGRHESTMFGEARKVLTEYEEVRQGQLENYKAAAGLPSVPESPTITGQDCNHIAPAEATESATGGTACKD